MNRPPSKEPEEEEILPLGEESRWRGEAPGEPGLRGVASVASVGVESRTTSLPQEGQKRAAPGISLPQAEQVMEVAEVYHCPLPHSNSGKHSGKRSFPRNGVRGSRRDASGSRERATATPREGVPRLRSRFRPPCSLESCIRNEKSPSTPESSRPQLKLRGLLRSPLGVALAKPISN